MEALKIPQEKHEQMYDRFKKDREIEFKQAKEKITFSLRGDRKYYIAFQCALFERNIIQHASPLDSCSARDKGLLFNKYSITVGDYYGRDLKTFDSKEEMIGFVIGYNEAISNIKSWTYQAHPTGCVLLCLITTEKENG